MRHIPTISSTLLMAALLAVPAPAQESTPPPREVAERSTGELDELLGPLALYPDDLVALMLPAAAEPTDIVLAARFLDDEGETGEIDAQPWSESVRALAHFEDVIVWMNQNLSWTRQVGEAFLAQPAAVMQSIQRLRSRAHAAGTLRDTPQQRVLVDGAVIRIVSAEENVIYVPTYDTKVVYVRDPNYYAPYFAFGIGWTIGSWHRWECDWYGNRVWAWDTHSRWREQRHTHFYVHNTYAYRPPYRYDFGGRAWRSPPVRVRQYHDNFHPRRAIIRPGSYVENHSRPRYQDRRHDGRPDRERVVDGRGDGDRKSIRHGVILPNNPRNDRPQPQPVTRSDPAPARDHSRDYLTRSRNRPPGEATAGADRRASQPRSTVTPPTVTRSVTPTPQPSRVATYRTSAPRDVPAPTVRTAPETKRSSASSSPKQEVAAPTRAPSDGGRSVGNAKSQESRDYLQRSRTTTSNDKNENNGGNRDSGGGSGRRSRGN